MQKAGGKQIEVAKSFYPPGSACVIFRAKERRQGTGDVPGRQGIWLGRSTRIPGGHRVAEVNYDETRQLWNISKTLERSTVTVDAGNVILKSRPAGQQITAMELEKAMLGQTAPRDAYVVNAIIASKTEGGMKYYRINWKGYSTKENTWELAEHLAAYGATEIMEEWEHKHGAIRLVQRSLQSDSVWMEAARHMIKRYKLGGTFEQHYAAYQAELDSVCSK